KTPFVQKRFTGFSLLSHVRTRYEGLRNAAPDVAALRLGTKVARYLAPPRPDTPQTWAKPPSTNNSTPVIKLLSSDARNTAAFAISSGLPSRPSGTVLLMLFKRSCPVGELPKSSRSPSVSIGPGLIAFTRMCRALRSVVHVRANERMAAFVAE